MALDGLASGIFNALGRLKGRRRLDEEELKDMLKSLRRALQEADFNVRQTKEITNRLEERMREEEPSPGVTIQTHALNILYTELVRMLGPAREIRPHGSTIMMVGLYGQGKTTTTAKLAEWYRRRHGVRVAVIEADVHRPGAYSQLQQLLEDSSVEVYGEPDEKDAAAIVRRGLAAHSSADVVIVDTAGRHQLDKELVVELQDMATLMNATERFLVIDAQGFTEWCLGGFDMLALAIEERGLKGLVINGAYRDIAQTKAANFPIYCKGTAPFSGPKLGPFEINTPVCCGGVIVHPGDLVVASNDEGIVIVPQNYISPVADAIDEYGKHVKDKSWGVQREADRNEYFETLFEERGGIYLD